jgi:hypothetical protein
MDSIRSHSEKTDLLLWAQGDRAGCGISPVSNENCSFITDEKLGISRDKKL